MRVRVPGAGRLSATASRSGRKLASGSKSVHGHNGRHRAALQREGGEALAQERPERDILRLTVKFKPTSGAAKRTSVTLTLNR